MSTAQFEGAKMNPDSNHGRVELLVAAQDAGPRKYVRQIAQAWPGYSFDVSTLHNKSGTTLGSPRQISLEDLRGFLSTPRKSRRVILTGTSVGDPPGSIDKALLVIGDEFQLPSVSVIETWNLFSERFVTSNGLLFPDFVIVNDDHAKGLAISSGIPGAKILGLGNPVFEDIERASGSISAKSQDRRDVNSVLFISEEIRDSWISPLRNYTEFECLDALRNSLPRNCALTIKLHPEENPSKYSYLGGQGVEIRKEMSFSEMVALPDRIVGMESTLLYELSIFRDDVISFVPNESPKSIFSSFPDISCVSSQDHLEASLLSPVSSGDKHVDSWQGSTERIVHFLLSIAS